MKDNTSISFKASPMKKILLIGLPVAATFLMSLGIFISRMNISGWVRIYGNDSFKAGSSGAFRIIARKGKLSKPVEKLQVELSIDVDDNKVMLGKATMEPGEKAVNLNVLFPPLKEGDYKINWNITTETGTENWKSIIKLSSNPPELPRILEEEGGEQDTNYTQLSSSSSKVDSLGNVISLHPYNGRGFRNRIRDILYVKAHEKSGKPLRAEISLEVKSGTIRIPKNVDCIPYLVPKELPKCMVEIKDGEKIPFKLTTDSLGLDSLTVYPMTSGVSFKINYSIKEGDSVRTGPQTEFDIGGLEDDVFIGYFSRIVPPEKNISFPVTGLGNGPFWLDIYSKSQWVKGYTVPLADYEGMATIDTGGLYGMYKAQSSLSYLPLHNSMANTTFWVHPYLNDPKIVNEAVVEALKIKQMDDPTSDYLRYISENGLVWKSGYSVQDDIHFFGGLLDRYHYEVKLLKDTRKLRESKLNRTKRGGQLVILSIIALSGIILVLTVFFAVFYSIRQRQKSIMDMSSIMADSDGNESFWANLHKSRDEIDARRKAIAFGVIIASIVGFVIVATIWLMIHVKWEM
ncbi:MAG: hypothetical protein JXR95_14810 [Deltaproteobacteria bacterium]|nr:hypothetical protein [Deltaproteobacteria bacterium]